MLPEDEIYINKYVMNIDEHHLSFQIVYDTVKLEVPFLSQQLGSAGVNFPKNLSNENSVFFQECSNPL